MGQKSSLLEVILEKRPPATRVEHYFEQIFQTLFEQMFETSHSLITAILIDVGNGL
jgi:hypothetical protein